MDGLQAVAVADAEGEDITEESVIIGTKTMTPRIDELLVSGRGVESADASLLVKCDIPSESTQSHQHCKLLPNNGDEKSDADPENSKKSCDVTPDTGDELSLADHMQMDGAPSSNSPSIKEDMMTVQSKDSNSDESPSDMSKSALAFTIDFNDGKQVDSKKKNDIFERFQKRHSRGASMSKLEGSPTPTAQTSVKAKPPVIKKAASTSTPSKTPLLNKTPNAVSVDDSRSQCSVQMRDKSRLSRKDATNSDQRHSWSPRNSMQLGCRSDIPAVDTPRQPIRIVEKCSLQKSNSFQPKSDTLQRAFQSMKASYPLAHDPEPVVCGAPPLEYIPSTSPNEDGSISSVSEAGTYTLDGDNYTEEQKQQMSIDKCSKAFAATSTHTPEDASTNNKLKVKTSYLDRIKSKVKNISDRTFHKKSSSPEANALPSKLPNPAACHPSSSTLDLGSFTSVTSAGVFSKHTIQQQITPKVRTSRKGSLTKSQIDNSEYIQKLDEQMLNSFTDYEKARHNDYQLNIFSGQQEAEIVSQPNSIKNSDSFGIERAETKNDWIQEWAKNARRNTKKQSDSSLPNAAQHNNIGRSNYEIQSSHHQYNPQGTSSSEFSDINTQARLNRRNHVGQVENENEPDDMHRFDMRKSSNRKEPSPFQSTRNGSGRRGSLNTFVHKKPHSEFGDDLDDDDQSTGSSLQPSSLMLDANDRMRRNYYQFESIANPSFRPPLSPTKIPSPMHSLSRPRSSSVNRSMHSSITDLDVHNDDTGMYLHKTAAAISQLQSIHRNNNSPQSPSSPQRQPNKIASNFMTSPSVRRHYKTAPFATINQANAQTESPQPPLYANANSMHKRNHSKDGYDAFNLSSPKRDQMTNSYNTDGLNALLNLKLQHSRHNSYEDKPSPVRSIGKTIDQTFAPLIVQRSHISSPNFAPQRIASSSAAAPSRADLSKIRSKSANVTPATIKRSSSFTTKPFTRPSSGGKAMTPKLESRASQSSLQKSASSNSFKNMSKFETDIYLNENDNLYANFSSESDVSERDTALDDKELLTNTRYNKSFLARLEQNKQRAAIGPAQLKQGVSACPNTPELPRRDMHVRQSLRDRSSMPRDSSINRMKQDISSNLAATKKGLTDSPLATSRSASTSGSTRVLPKYLDISKYKPTQGNSFLKRDESKSTLNPQHKEIKRSNSSFGVGMNKSDAARSSVRSVKSATTTNRTTMATMKNEAAREADLAMWRRRASYDPMKAAAEGKRKLEEKKTTHASKYNESSSVVMRSKSYHSGVGQSASGGPMDAGESTTSKRWTVISTESSDEEFVEEY